MSTSEVKLDALPYFDQGYDEVGVREAVSPVGDGKQSTNYSI